MDELLQRFLAETPLTPEAVRVLADIDSKAIQFQARQFFVSDDPLTNEEPKVVLDYYKPPHELVRNELVWSERLENELLKRSVRMDSPEDDALRFGSLLLSNLRYADLRFGKTYTDSVLWDVVNERLGSAKPIAEALASITHLIAEKNEGYAECFDYLKTCLSGIGNSLVVQLGYQDPLAFGVLVAAAFHMLDRRYFITLRRQLYPKTKRE